MEASFSLGWDVIGWRQSVTTGETLRKKGVERKFTPGNDGILAGDNLAVNSKNTENNSEMKNKVDEIILHRMAKVHNILERWQGSQHLRATQNDSPAQNMEMTAVGYISDMEEIVKASWSLLHPDGAAALKLSEWSPLPPAGYTKNIPGGKILQLNDHRIRRINHHAVESDEDSTPASISDAENWLDWNGDLDNPNDSEDDCVADFESDLEHDNGIEDPECPEQQDVTAIPNVPRLIQSTLKSKTQNEQVLVPVNAMETRRNERLNTK